MTTFLSGTNKRFARILEVERLTASRIPPTLATINPTPMEAAITPFVEQLSALDALEYKLRELGSTEPAKAYLLANAIDKVASRAKKDFSE